MRNQLLSEIQAKKKLQGPGLSEVRPWTPGGDQSPARQPEWRIKTYYAASMQTAISQARMELGEDAILMSSRSTPIQNRHLGEYEVVFGVGPTAPAATEPAAKPIPEAAPAPRAEPTREKPVREPANNREWSSLSMDVAGMRKQLLQIHELLHQNGVAPSLPRLPDASKWHSRLVASGIPDELAIQILESARESLDDFQEEADPAHYAVAEALKKRFGTNPTLGVAGQETRVAILVGPPGCGKTTSLIKLAIREGMLMQMPVTLVSLDRDRISAMQQMESYADILGLQFRQLDTVGALDEYLAGVNGRELIVIDTNGISASDIDTGRELAEFLSRRKDIDVHLVLPANVRDSDLTRMANRFALFSPKKLIFTMVDETESYGVMVRESARTGKPISFISMGRQIPEDMERATPDGIATLVLNGKIRRKMSGSHR